MADVTVEFGATDTGLEKTLKAVQDELTQLKGKVTSGELSMTDLETTMKRIGQVTTMEKNIKAIGDSSTATSPKVEELNKDIKKTGDNSEDAGKKAGAGFGQIAIGAGIAGAAVKLGTAAIDAAFAAAQKTVQSFGDALNMGGRLADLSDRTGVAVDKLLILERAFQNTGVGADSLGPIINKMQKAIVDAGDGSTTAADAFTKLGIPLSSLKNLSPDQQLQAIGKAVASIPDPAERAAVSMDIFGKSGGALNQVFANMDGEIATAKSQLGSLPDVMKAGAAQFDKISDNLTIVGGKFVDFAAGILDKVKPALDALTTAMTRIDATKLGQDLAGFFTGAGAGMKGFQAAVQAIDAGQMGIAFKIVGQAIQMQFKDTGNSIYATLIATFQTISDFAIDQFASGSPLILAITSAFDYVSGYIKSVVAGSLADTFTNLGPAFNRIAAGLKDSAAAGALAAELALQRIPVAAQLAAQKASDSMGKIPDDFKANMAGVPPLFTDIEKHQVEIDRLQQGIKATTQATVTEIDEEAKAQAAAEQEARKYFAEYKKGQADVADANAKKTADQAKQNQLKQDELTYQLDLATAQAAGDSARVQALQDSKKYADDLKKALDAGLDPTQAALFATNMAIAANNSRNIKYLDANGNPLFFDAAKKAAELSSSLASAIGFADTLSKMKDITALQTASNSAKAARDELKAMDKLLGTDLAQKSFPDLAKKLGVDKIGQTGQDQIAAVVTYLNGVKTQLSANPINSAAGQQSIKDVINFMGGNPLNAKLLVDYQTAKTATDAAFSSVPTKLDATKTVADLRNDVKSGIEIDVSAKSGVSGLLDAIKIAVEAIKAAVEKIEPKLPQKVLA